MKYKAGKIYGLTIWLEDKSVKRPRTKPTKAYLNFIEAAQGAVNHLELLEKERLVGVEKHLFK